MWKPPRKDPNKGMAFLRQVLVSLLILTISYATIGYLVDPEGIFHGRFFPPALLNARAQKVHLYRQFARDAEATGVSLGSSRTMVLDPDVLTELTGYRFFNFGVESARTEDSLAIYRWLRKQGNVPKVVLVGVDVESLNPTRKRDPKLQLSMPLRLALEGGSSPGGPVLERIRIAGEQFGNMFRVRYAQEMLTSVRVALPGGPKQATVIEPNGHLAYVRAERLRASGKFNSDSAVRKGLKERLDAYRGMDRLSPLAFDNLQSLLREAAADGAKVVLWLTPNHPVAVDFLTRETNYAELVQLTGSALQSLAATNGCVYHDLSSMGSFKGTAADWYDDQHMAPANARRVAARLTSTLRPVR